MSRQLNKKTRSCGLLRLRNCLLLALTLGLAATAWSEGFRNPTIGTSDLGRSGGRIAQVDDATAVQQNPANLTGLTNATVEVSPSVIYISSDFHSAATGQSASSTDPWKALPNIFMSIPIKSDKLVAGLGITSPFGLGNEWNQGTSAFAPGGSLRYLTPYSSQLETINLNPTLAIRLLDNLSLGVGLDAMWSDLTMEQYYPSFLLGSPGDSHVKAEGNGWGWGGNLGLTWKITSKQRLAVTYRSPMNVYYDGQASVNNIAPAEAAAGITGSSSFNSSVKFPTMVGAGYGVDVTDKIHLESDFEWIQFARFKSLNLNLANNTTLFTILHQSSTTPENWHNTFTAGIGGAWDVTDHWVLRGGYQFFESPVPNSTFSPTIPDANQNVLTFGVGWHNRHHSLEASYGLDFYNDRHITGDVVPAFNGTYTFTVHLLSFAYSYKF
jgi:long-chain fatty acid transport protein